MGYSRVDFEIVFLAGFGFVFGLIAFFKGFRNLKLKRIIENIPTSKIRSLPMGIVEIMGQAVKSFDMMTPFSNLPCVFFQYIVEELKRSGKHSKWVTIAKYTSPLPFQVTDETGQITVNPQGAEVELKTKNTFSNSFFGSLPGHAKDFLERNGINYTSWLGFSKTMRLTEMFIQPGSRVYALGVAKHAGDAHKAAPGYKDILEKKNLAVMETLRKLKKSDILMKRYDKNRDGTIDQSEWEAAREDVIKWVEHEISKEPPPEVGEIRVEIGKGDEGQAFYIADRSQSEILGAMFWRSTGSIIGGGLLTVICATVLLVSFF